MDIKDAEYQEWFNEPHIGYWSKKPLEPGMKGTIKVKFDTSGREGEQKKFVTINSNADNFEVKLQLKANIVSDR